MNRRLLNERNKLLFYESQKLISVIVDENLEENNNKYFKFRIYVKYNHKFIIVKLLYNSYYPFRHPTAIISGKSYLKLLRNYTINDPQIFKYVFPVWNCLCCTSFLCGDNWGPSLKSTDILDEIVDNYLLKVRIIEIFFAKKIVNMYISIPYIDNFFFNYF